MRTYLQLLAIAVRCALRSRHDLVLENLVLRRQLAVYLRQLRRRKLRDRDRRFWSLLARTWSGWRSVHVIVEPDTVVRRNRTAGVGTRPGEVEVVDRDDRASIPSCVT